jgi:uncharacterized protein (DUF1800 family)
MRRTAGRLLQGLLTGGILLAVAGPVLETSAAPTMGAAQLLTQATFGPTPADIQRVQRMGASAWIDEQLSMPLPPSHLALRQSRGEPHHILHGFWQLALSEPGQLRLRVAYALSQILVVSAADGCGMDLHEGMASYMDLLNQHALGNYRDVLKAVATHPVMGCFLSHLRNRKEDPRTGRTPDENFARELMQLFTIGLHQLNLDGTVRLDRQGEPIETYGPEDVAGLARVFTGWSWDCPGHPSEECFQHWGMAPRTGPNPWARPMKPYLQFHSTSEKRFLGRVIPSQWTPDPESDLEFALDTLMAHANTAPFVSRLLIQRLVTSNPSPGYVARVARVFRDTDGHLGATVKQILLDPEAQQPPPEHAEHHTERKVREPVLRMTVLLRAFDAQSTTGRWLIGNTRDASTGLNQAPFQAPSVFNFYRPGYRPQGSATARLNKVAPELQIADETSLAGQARFFETLIWAGIGEHVPQPPGRLHPSDVKMDYQRDPQALALQLADQPEALVELANQRLLMGQMSSLLRRDIEDAVRHAAPPPLSDHDRHRRVWTALLLTVMSPEFMVEP